MTMEQVLDKQALDMLVFSNLNKVPYGENIKEYFMNEFRKSPLDWDQFFKEGSWAELDESARAERESIINEALINFDLKRATLDL